MEKDKLYFFYDGKTPLGAWMSDVCQTCVKQFGYGTDACNKCPFQSLDSDCLMCRLNRENEYHLNKISLQQIKDSVTSSQWQFLKSHCNFKDEYDEETDRMEEMDLVNTINDLAAKQKELGFVDNDTSRSKWHVGKPEENGSYIVVTVYDSDHSDKVKSMYLAEWNDGEWDCVPYEDIVLCWMDAPEMPVITLSVDNQTFIF